MVCKSAITLRSNFWNDESNPNNTSFLNDTWIFNIPAKLKLTYINMDFPIQTLNIAELLNGNVVNYDDLANDFTKNLNWKRISKQGFNYDSNSHLTWLVSDSSIKISFAV